MSLPANFRSHLRANNKKGEVLIGIIIALGVFMILSQAVMVLAFSAYDLVSYTRARISARHIASEEIETIRNAPYDDVGTIGGIPAGIFEQERQVLRNGQTYTVRTRIGYVDDEFDGTFPEDTLSTDYKRVRVDVSWGGLQESNFSEVTMVTDIAPDGIETEVGGGTLSILVFNALGEPVPQALVEVTANTNPPVDTSYFTSDTGRVVIPGAPICTSCYQITVSKDGYSTDRTYSVEEIENPTKPMATIIEANLTEISFTIDEYASLALVTVNTEDLEFTPLPNQVVRIYGEKKIGTDGLDNPVYKFDQEIVTDSTGTLTIEELEWDTYHLELPDDTTNDIAYTNPLNPLAVSPGEDVNLQIALTPDTESSLSLNFQNSSNELVASVAATLKDDTGFEASATTGLDGSVNFGQVFFNNLEDKLYTIIATASGYLPYQNTIVVNGDTKSTGLLSQ